MVQGLDDEVYHDAIDFVSHSMTKVFKRSRREFKSQFVSRDHPARRPTKAMELGTVVHSVCIEPHLLESVCIPIPPEVLSKSGSRAGAAWKEFKESNSDKILLTPKELETVRAMYESVYEHPIAGKIMRAEGAGEASIFWNDADSGFDLRCRVDKVVAASDGCPGYLIDVKTTNDLSDQWFAKYAAQFGYHSQAAFYQRGWQALTGEAEPLPFLFVAVQSSWPYTVRVLELDPEAMRLGAEQNGANLQAMRECVESRDWSDAFETEIAVLSLPAWAFNN
tara:strand:- start:1 stop:837 length:837 start_codon:yes stop_codon:yes gene_type:complete